MTLLVDDEGKPLGMVDLDAVHDDGERLAYRLAAAADDERRVELLIAATVRAYGPRAAGPVFAAALRTLTTDVTAGLLDVTDEIGVPARAKLTAMAAVVDR